MKTNNLHVMLPGQGEVLNILGSEYLVKVPGSATDGAFSMVESITPVGSGVPPHTHTREDETFHILEGTLEIQCGGHTIIATKGTTALLPRNVPHSYRNAGDTPVRMFFILSPAGFEGFFEEVNKLPSNPGELMKVGQKYGLQFVASA